MDIDRALVAHRFRCWRTVVDPLYVCLVGCHSRDYRVPCRLQIPLRSARQHLYGNPLHASIRNLIPLALRANR